MKKSGLPRARARRTRRTSPALGGPNEQRVPLKSWVSALVWARAGGRCSFPGCNKPLWKEILSSQHDVNVGEIAHIVAAKPNGPRGHPVDSKRLR